MQTISEISDSSFVPHIAEGFFEDSVHSAGDSLPYDKLGGPGLERLCFSLIAARGGVPRYFGDPGQKQYGIDLLVSNGAECSVYQCKNVNDFTHQTLAKVLRLFEETWLAHTQLPTPNKFVLCCPLPLRERRRNEEWTNLESTFFDKTGVQVEIWHKEYLDNQLRYLPDVVSDLFSNEAAERFCALPDWNEDLFRPVRFGSGEPTVNRYLEKKSAGQIYLDGHLSEAFTLRLERHGKVLILGLPGSGKTFTSLALAESFQGISYRIFYINMRRDFTEDALVKGIRRRLTRPTIFLMDDCHGKYDILEGVEDRLQEVAARQPGKLFLVYTARTTPTPEGMPRADYSDFVQNATNADAVLRFHPTLDLFGHIAVLHKADLRMLSQERRERIFMATGGDLFLLDQLLDMIKSPEEIDDLQPEHLFEVALRRYFGKPTVHRPGFMRLTALAQFEIAPLVSDFPFDITSEDPAAAAELVVEADRPLRYFFLHSSAAELVFRALAWNNRTNNVEAAALNLVAFFSSRSANDSQLPTDLSNVLRNQLKLRVDKLEEYLLKTLFLGDDRIYALIDSLLDLARLRLNNLALILNILKDSDTAAFQRYGDLLKRRIDDGTILKSLMTSVDSQFLAFIRREYASWYSTLREQFANDGLPQVVRTNEIQNLLKILSTFASQENFVLTTALNSVSDDEIEELAKRTIKSRRSISNINWTFRELRNTDPSLLEELWQRIGAKRFLRMMITGTLPDLFSVLHHSTVFMAGQLIEVLDDKAIDELINNTILAGRSIATLHLKLRELKELDSNLLEQLEQKIGAQRYLDLIASAGTLFELFRMIQYASPLMVQQLIQALDEKTINYLVDKTITLGRSIGTLDFTLREFKLSDPDVLNKLEQKIGVERWWKLILANGRISMLPPLMQHVDSSFRSQLVRWSQRLTLADWEKLILHGDFSHLTAFVKWGGRIWTKLFTPTLMEELKPAFEKLVSTANWSTLFLGSYRLKEAPESKLKVALESVLDEHLSEIQIDRLHLADFEEGVRCIGLLWRRAPSKKAELVKYLFDVLPEASSWYTDPDFLPMAQRLLSIMAISPFPSDNYRRVLDLCNSENVTPILKNNESLEIFLYLWNLYSVWFKCEKVLNDNINATFSSFLNPRIRERINHLLELRMPAPTDRAEQENLIALIGLLHTSGLIAISKEVKTAWSANLPTFDELLEGTDAMETLLVPSFFLIGLGWLFDRTKDIPRATFSRFLSNIDLYEETTDAINNFRRSLEKHLAMRNEV